jgi:predicted nucleic acid-binding protein
VIAVDASTLVAFVQGDRGPDVERFDASLLSGDVTVPPVVITEVLSDPKLPRHHRELVLSLPPLELADGYWVRAGATRATILGQKLRARLADSLIAQACIDANIPLLTRDRDFRHYSKHCGLQLAL